MTKKIYEWIEHPELLDKESLYTLRSLLACYPYFPVLRLLYLKNLYILGDKQFDEELHKSSIYMNERKVLFSILEGSKYTSSFNQVEDRKSSEAKPDRTGALIDAFLSSKDEDVEKMKLSMEATTDYASLLLEKENEEPTAMRGQELIDNFVNKDMGNDASVKQDDKTYDIAEPEVKESSEKTEYIAPSSAQEHDKEAENQKNDYHDDDDESYFTETLAKIYIKQGRYSKAIEIIKKLNLKYPKKNVYFADQIRFLEKLIINTKSK